MRFKNKKAIVTGGANGMGRATAEWLRDEGATVAVLDRDREAGAALEGIEFSACDVLDRASFEAAFAAALETLGGLDVMVHIAGASRGGMVLDQDIEDWDWHYQVNLRSHVIGCRLAAAAMVDQGSGAIVTMSSISGLRGDPGWAAYNATKAAIRNFTESLAWELGPRGIRVNAVCPGPVASERMLASLSDPNSGMKRYADATALGRLVDPSEAAAAILFLASDAASAITGHALVVDCGLTARTGQPIAGVDF